MVIPVANRASYTIGIPAIEIRGTRERDIVDIKPAHNKCLSTGE